VIAALTSRSAAPRAHPTLSKGSDDIDLARHECLRSISTAIRKADDQFFRSDYVRLGEAVIKALRDAGYAVVPRSPTTAMMAEGQRRMVYGVQSAGSMMEAIFSSMIEAWDDELDHMRRLEKLRQLASRRRSP